RSRRGTETSVPSFLAAPLWRKGPSARAGQDFVLALHDGRRAGPRARIHGAIARRSWYRRRMKHSRRLALSSALSTWLAISCSTRVPASAIAWTDHTAVLAPSATAASGSEGMNGTLRIETDTDVRVNGS